MIIETNKTYIHYGTTHFNPNFKGEIINNPTFTKPIAGFWASPIDADFGWKDWNDVEYFALCEEENSIRFKLHEGNKVLLIQDESDIIYVKDYIINEYLSNRFQWCSLDFERLLKDGIDGVEIVYNEFTSRAMYAWDCDSIVILNPDVVEIIDD